MPRAAPPSAPGLAAVLWSHLAGSPLLLEHLEFQGVGALPSAYAVSDFAAASIGVAYLATAELIAAATGRMPLVRVDRHLASLWFGWSLRPLGWTLPPAWDPLAGDYRTRDGWIRLHTNAASHRAAALHVLGDHASRDAMAAVVVGYRGAALEHAILAAGGCAAELRSPASWAAHPQGRAVAAEPVIDAVSRPGSGRRHPVPTAARPLQGLRVLDLTRVLAGPVATRFLAGFGATVLRIDPPGFSDPGVVPETTLGKQCATLDLHAPQDRASFEFLLAGADILVHGYRPGALEALGYGPGGRRAIAPGLIDLSLNAYGWTGPWAGRRGFDSLVQMSSGIAHGPEHPTPLPVQALDHATGYLMAAAALRALTTRLRTGAGADLRLSLARTAALLPKTTHQGPAFPSDVDTHFSPSLENTDWGPAHRLRPPATIDTTPTHWDRPARSLGSAAARW